MSDVKKTAPEPVHLQLWVVFGLAISAVGVSALGAWFSIEGLGKLFSGAVLSVWMMAGALEVAKFTIAAFLHQVWPRLNFLFKTYLLASVVTLSGITSLGIFGFLSDAYQESSIILEGETVKLEKLKADQIRIEADIERLNKSIEEIPDSRITRKMKARAEAEPLIVELRKKQETTNAEITQASLKVLAVKGKVGPLIYIGRAFKADIDTVVKYLILAFVLVFDPLALCLVVAFSMAIKIRKEQTMGLAYAEANPDPVTTIRVHHEEDGPQAPVAAPAPEEERLKMRFSEEDDSEPVKKAGGDSEGAG